MTKPNLDESLKGLEWEVTIASETGTIAMFCDVPGGMFTIHNSGLKDKWIWMFSRGPERLAHSEPMWLREAKQEANEYWASMNRGN